jgi:hypothetical protein
MDARYTNISELEKALNLVNERYKGNITFKKLEPKGKRVNFTLTVNNTKDPGYRRGFQGRKVSAACWHAHGHFFECLFQVNPKAEVFSRWTGHWITQHGGNWQDKNIGSLYRPLEYSAACDCNGRW